MKLQKAGALDLLEKATVAQSPEERRESLEQEVEAYLAANDGRRPAWTSSLYVKLQKAGALDLLEKATVAQSPEERRESLEQEVEAYLAANDGRRLAWTSPLYVKFQKAGALDLLEKATVAQSPDERRQSLEQEVGFRPFGESHGGSVPGGEAGSLEQEVEAYLAANDGRRCVWTSIIFIREVAKSWSFRPFWRKPRWLSPRRRGGRAWSRTTSGLDITFIREVAKGWSFGPC